jgi:hypothetical protein
MLRAITDLPAATGAFIARQCTLRSRGRQSAQARRREVLPAVLFITGLLTWWKRQRHAARLARHNLRRTPA